MKQTDIIKSPQQKPSKFTPFSPCIRNCDIKIRSPCLLMSCQKKNKYKLIQIWCCITTSTLSPTYNSLNTELCKSEWLTVFKYLTFSRLGLTEKSSEQVLVLNIMLGLISSSKFIVCNKICHLELVH